MSTATTATAPAPIKTLTLADRCDRCGAEAKVRATFTTGDLLFCGHHGKAYLDKMTETAVNIVDEGIVR